ncbi:MAG: hypothetical protein IPP74_14165 [Alphaproteobacteria bacterium]|nr:hypothetical protein [Alphaproteobacteria bacterium]
MKSISEFYQSISSIHADHYDDTPELVGDENALIHAAAKGDVDEMATLLFDEHVDPNETDCLGNSAGHWALIAQQPESYNFWFDNGGNINHHNDQGLPVLFFAFKHVNIYQFPRLVETTNVLFEKKQSHYAPIHLILGCERYDLLLQLPDLKKAIHTNDLYGNSPLCYAFQQGFSHQIRHLLKNGAPADVTDLPRQLTNDPHSKRSLNLTPASKPEQSNHDHNVDKATPSPNCQVAQPTWTARAALSNITNFYPR